MFRGLATLTQAAKKTRCALNFAILGSWERLLEGLTAATDYLRG